MKSLAASANEIEIRDNKISTNFLFFVFLCIVFKYNCKHNADKQILAFKWYHLLLVGHALNRSCLTKTSTRNEL